MFDNYPQSADYIPNNRPRPIFPHKISIMTGESTVHTFEIPFNVVEDTVDVEVMYKLGLNVILTKSADELEIVVKDNGHTFITCPISVEESLMFKNTVLSKFVQLKFIMKDLSTQMSEIYRVNVVDSLDAATRPIPPEPGPGIITGIGYTED